MKICFNILYYFRSILHHTRKADFVHSRGPSVPMLLALIISLVYKRPGWWFKYANNWSDPRPPASWNFQRFLMIKNSKSVGTVNGSWKALPNHIFPFENPCLADEFGRKKVKVSRGSWRLLFVGRLEEKKGFGLILDAIDHIPIHKIESITFIGDGEGMNLLQAKAKRYLGKIDIIIQGSQPKERVFSEMYNADFILLPSKASEGFPKVIAEAWYNGCVPVVSSVSCVNQYVINGINGFVWDLSSDKFYWEVLQDALAIKDEEYYGILDNGSIMCKNFTYDHYSVMIRQKLLAEYN